MTNGGLPSDGVGKTLKRKFNSNNPPGKGPPLKKIDLKPPPPPPPPVSGVGVMDVGQGSCILAYDQAGNPLFYYDMGYPLVFYRNSAPATLRRGLGNYLGPCLFQNPRIYLSHWDWDHYRLAHTAHLEALHHGVDVVDLHWIFPVQNIGPAAGNFRALFTNAHPLVAPSQDWFDGHGNIICTVLQCVGGDINNSGLAMVIPTRLPSADVADHLLVFTGDASFANVPLTPPMLANTTGITAVHHGADTHGAAANLPNPPVPYNVTGRIAYSYGVYQRNDGTFVHPYGHPRAVAILAYALAGWGNRACTAESAFYANDGVRGNIRMGQFIVFQCPAGSCAFQAFPLAKRLD